MGEVCRSLVHGVLLSLGDLRGDARVAGQRVLRLREHVALRRHELALVVRAAQKVGTRGE